MTKLEIFYSNVITSVERHEYLQNNFASCNFKPHWTLNRFVSLDANNPAVQSMPGALGIGGKGAYLSELEILRQCLGHDCHTMVMEDDFQFCPKSQQVIDFVLGGMTDDSWDLLFTDTIIPNAIDMPRFLYERRIYEQTGNITILSLPVKPYRTMSGTVIVNKASRQKILDLMSVDDLSIPWDVLMGSHIASGAVRAFLIFPFATCPSLLADRSTLQALDNEGYVSAEHAENLRGRLEHALHNDFSRMIWVGREDDAFFATDPLSRFGDLSKFSRPDVERMCEIMKPLLGVMMRYPS